MKYFILKSADYMDLVAQVDEFLKFDWKCQGGITVSHDGVFYQAITNESDNPHIPLVDEEDK